MVTAERLREVVNYDPETGVLLRRTTGRPIGGISQEGYHRLTVDGVLMKGHRAAWMIHTGREPDGEIDHINGIKSDNRFSNLRDVTHEENTQNQRAAHVSSRSGLLGVSYHKRLNKWQAGISTAGKRVHLGYFATPEMAHDKYVEAKRLLHGVCSI